MDIGTTSTPNGQAAPGALIRDGSTATFQADVLDASRQVPVIVDFWAPWCGPCKQLGPAIEKAVTALGGKVRLVKINVDENQALAGQMGVQSIPAVFAFAGGRPVDGFMGALPESEIKRFLQRIIDQAGGGGGGNDLDDQIKEALAAADQAVTAGDFARARQIYAAVLQHAPDNVDALVGLAALALEADQPEEARAILDQVPEEGRKSPNYLALLSRMQLADEAAGLGSAAELEARIARDPDDLQARFDLAVVLNAAGRKIEAAEALVALMRRDRQWNEDGARKKLLELFEAWGPKDPATLKGRRMLSSVLFS